MRVFGQTKAVRRAGATALLTGLIVFAVARAATGTGGTSVLTDSTPEFTISSTISSSPNIQKASLLYPGVQRYLWYTVSNPQNATITVLSLSVSGVTAPAGCPSTNLDYGSTAFSGDLAVPADGTNSVAVPISLNNAAENQNGCENANFAFTVAGSATYGEVYSTESALASSANPVPVGGVVTYTVDVTASAAVGQDPVPSGPTGTVTFMDGVADICSAVPVTAASGTDSTASCTPPPYALPSSHAISAAYVDSDGNFSGSSSEELVQVVSP